MRSNLHYSNKEIAILSLLSGMWALSEINLGLIFRVLKVPFSGAILTFLGLIILFLARDAVPRRGTSILLGILTAYLKLIFLGALAFFPIVAILVESILVEISLSGKKINRANTIVAGALAMSWSLVHPFFTQGILSGWGIGRVYSTFFQRNAELFGVNSHDMLLVLMVAIFFHIILGILAALLCWKLTRQIAFLLPNQMAREH